MTINEWVLLLTITGGVAVVLLFAAAYALKKKPAKFAPYQTPPTIAGILTDHINAKKEMDAMFNYWDEHLKCDELPQPSKALRKRYGRKTIRHALAWYLLEKYFEGKVVIIKD